MTLLLLMLSSMALYAYHSFVYLCHFIFETKRFLFYSRYKSRQVSICTHSVRLLVFLLRIVFPEVNFTNICCESMVCSPPRGNSKYKMKSHREALNYDFILCDKLRAIFQPVFQGTFASHNMLKDNTLKKSSAR